MESNILADEALKVFITHWDSQATNEVHDFIDDKGYPDLRSSYTAHEMLANYIEERKPFLTNADTKLIAVELPFAVPLTRDKSGPIYVGRLDKVFESQGRVYIGEHKTTTSYKKDGPFRSDFTESFSPNSQVDGYLYAANMLYGKQFKAVWIDAALVHKTEHDGFRFLPVEHHFAQLDAWLWETLYYINQIKANGEAIAANLSTKHPFLAAFPKNTKSCTDFGLCPYINVCRTVGNPQSLLETPDGYILEKWEPFDELEFHKNKGKTEGLSGTITKTNDLFDNTRVSASRTCLRQFYFRHVRHWRTDGERRALLFGSAWHVAMDFVWTELCSTKKQTVAKVKRK